MSRKKQTALVVLGFIAWFPYMVVMIVFFSHWAAGSTAKSLILTLLIVIPIVPMILYLRRWSKRRGNLKSPISVYATVKLNHVVEIATPPSLGEGWLAMTDDATRFITFVLVP